MLTVLRSITLLDETFALVSGHINNKCILLTLTITKKRKGQPLKCKDYEPVKRKLRTYEDDGEPQQRAGKAVSTGNFEQQMLNYMNIDD